MSDLELMEILLKAEINNDPFLLEANANEKPMAKYTHEFMSKAGHLEKTNDLAAYRRYVLKKGPFISVPDLPKCNQKAAEVRQVGNRHYLKKEYHAALEKYNESICWSEGDSEDLGIGYANRSATYYDGDEFEFALANIALAKKHNYPQRLMPKLLARELNCREKIKQRTECNNPSRLAMNLEVNPKIPCLAKGISMQQLPGYGRAMIAERNFKVGDVILNEWPMIAGINTDLKYLHCNFCSSGNFRHLIPCPNCVSVMYCSEKCLEKDMKVSHRFECGITEKLHHISYGKINMGPKMFFYGLSLFKDNVKEMMEYCESHPRTGGNPFRLDYTKCDPLDEFKVFHQTKLPTKKFIREHMFRFYAAMYYSIYIDHPLIKALFTSEPQKMFMLRQILDYMRIFGFLNINNEEPFTSLFFSIASVVNHSCVPNTLTVSQYGQMKFIVLLPIAAGEQIVISYDPLYDEQCDYERINMISMMHFDCLCVVCNPKKAKSWLARSKTIPPIPRNHLAVLHTVINEETGVNNAAKLNALQQFVGQYSYVYPREDFNAVLKMYRSMLKQIFADETNIALRPDIV